MQRGAHGIEVDVLNELTEQDLTTIGLSLGDRKRLLKAIRARSWTAACLKAIRIVCSKAC